MQPEWIAALFEPDGRTLARLGRQSQRKQNAKKLLGDWLYERLWAIVNHKEPGTDGNEEGAE
jgi:hypothetical protein